MNGLPLMIVAKHLGHADMKMIERFYGHLAPSYVADAVRPPRFGFVAHTKTRNNRVTPMAKRGRPLVSEH